MSLHDHSHARRNRLTSEWVLVSPHRTERPWQGQLEESEDPVIPAYDPTCYLCPGNDRANSKVNPAYENTFVFGNDFPALSNESEIELTGHPVFEARTETGYCRVVCYSARHDRRLATMSDHEVARAIDAMITEFRDLDARDDCRYVQIFENRGQMMGCSNQHPHAQIWATKHLPNEPAKELASQLAYFETHKTPLLIDYLEAELADGARLVADNEHFVCMIPFWATWPFETLILPRRILSAPDELRAEEVLSLANILRLTMSAYDKLFEAPAPYSMGFHPRPSDGGAHPEWQFHIHIYPPLLRSANIRKHLVGFEMLGMPQRDLTPEVAAKRLRAAYLNETGT